MKYRLVVIQLCLVSLCSCISSHLNLNKPILEPTTYIDRPILVSIDLSNFGIDYIFEDSDKRVGTYLVPLWFYTTVKKSLPTSQALQRLSDNLKRYFKSNQFIENKYNLSPVRTVLKISLMKGGMRYTHTNYGLGFYGFYLYIFGFMLPFDYFCSLEMSVKAELISTENGLTMWGPKYYHFTTDHYTRPAFFNSTITKVLSKDVVLQIAKLSEDIILDIKNGLPLSEQISFYDKFRYFRTSTGASQSQYEQETELSQSYVSNKHVFSSVMQGWAVIIGLSKYQYANQNGLTNLIYADSDAIQLKQALIKQGWCDDHIKLLLNEQATQRNIKIALEDWLTKTKPEDTIVLFWSGHGFPHPDNPEKVYFACYDTNILQPATAYRMDKVRDAIEERNARNVVVMADTCHAGKLITRATAKNISIMSSIEQMKRKQTVPNGWIFMVSADTDRQAIEHTSWSNGAFTHCLLEALDGKADGYMSAGARDGVVTMGELRTYVSSVMPDETLRVLGVAKHPTITTSSGDPDIWNLSLKVE